MTKPRIKILGTHSEQLVSFLTSHKKGHERAAAVLFRKISRSVNGLPDSDRYISHDVTPFPDEWIPSSSALNVDFLKAPLRGLYRRCEEEDLVFGFVHNHPNSVAKFSTRDGENEASLLTGITNRNGKNSSLVALLFVNGKWLGRIRHGNAIKHPIDARHIAVISNRIEMYGPKIVDEATDEVLARQSAAFGKPFSAKLNSLRIAVVGAGGTGSSTTTLLARSGVGELISIDFDPFERSNLNRVRGSRAKDEGKNKAKIQEDFINELGLPCIITSIEGMVDIDYEAVAAISTADVVFGCTDDWAGRATLNKAVYYYGIPLIDVGLGGKVDEDKDGLPVLKNHAGRVSCILPEAGRCLFCQGVIRQEWIDYQLAVRRDPEQAERDIAEGYLENGGVAAPGVGPFTGITADLAVSTLFNLLKPYRRLPPDLIWDGIFVDFVNMRFFSKLSKRNPECEFCEERAFLLKRERSYLLGRPKLKEEK